MLLASGAFAAGRPVACPAALEPGRTGLKAQLVTLGTATASVDLPLPPGHEWLIEARERGNDAVVEIRDAADHLVGQADHPERRTGTRRVILVPAGQRPLTLRVTGKEHFAVSGTVEIAVFDLAALARYPVCARVYHALADADADYAVAQQVSLGHLPAGNLLTHERYQRAAQEYAAADALLGDRTDALLRGEVDLALAGVWYFDLQDWRQSAAWARAAQTLLSHRDGYRLARARAIAAAAWIEMATDATSPGNGAAASDPNNLLRAARHTLYRLLAFHDRRAERYDAALQLNNIAIAYSYEARYSDCVAAARSASHRFAQLRETPRQALAWQNLAMCYWGLGHLPQALDAFNRALDDLQPDPYPQLYLATLNNTALMHYALGHFDESLRLLDRALALAKRSQNQREEAQSLYGIGVTYYALGDRDLAREFLERSLALRTAASDGRGRRDTLRSLATLYADLGEYQRAMEWDRESLTLATTPRSRARSRIQLAAHAALNGNPGDALATLDTLIRPGTLDDAGVVAQAHLERAVIAREGGRYEAALRDLAAAIPVFRRSGSAFDQFSADLERARTLQLAGKGSASLAAVEQALTKSATIRSQTANPEFRAQLQLPLRAAYDLKLDILWTQYESAMQAGRHEAAAQIASNAFTTADGARARSFNDIALQQYSADARRELGSAMGRREELYQNLAGLRFSLDSRLDHSGSTDPRGKRLQSEIAELQREVDTLDSRIATRTALRSIAAPGAVLNAANGQMRLPGAFALITYWMGAHSAYSWVVTPEGTHWVRLSDPESITVAARTFHDSLQRLSAVTRDSRLDAAAALYDKIVRPLERWANPYRSWYFVPDAALSYVAFAALRDAATTGSGYLVTSHDIALTPAAWLLWGGPRRPDRSAAPQRILLVSDPIYELSDPRLDLPAAPAASALWNAAGGATRDHLNQAYTRLPATAREAAAIQGQFASAAIDAFDGVRATRAQLLRANWSQYRFIHIATHGHIDARTPQLSALILSSYNQHGERIEDALRSADLSALTLNAEVVVFSGCDTALGKEVLNEGMVGLAYTTLARGAGAVVSSLWQVPDEMTANLMTEFYRHLLRDAMSPASALAATMRAVLIRNPSADPALWAAFQVSVVGMPGEAGSTVAAGMAM